MARKRTKSKRLIAAAAAFAATPQGRRLLQMAREYASRPETQQRARELLAQARTRTMSRSSAGASSRSNSSTPSYGTPPRS